MKKIVLKIGLSYSTKDLKCKKGSPFDVEDDVAEKLMATGRFEELQADISAPDQEEKPTNIDNISSMKKEELIAYAAAHGISIEDCKNNEERVERIKNAIAVNDFAKSDIET